jgi:hypothetical protein
MEHLCKMVSELEPFVKSRATMFVGVPLEPRKAIGLVLYWFAHGVSANIITNRFNVGVSIVCKYVDIVVSALISKDKLFSWYICIPHGPCLLKIMHGFFHACGLPNVCGAIDGSHILLSQKPNKWVTIIPTIIIIDLWFICFTSNLWHGQIVLECLLLGS